MTRGRNTAEILGGNGEVDEMELSESGDQGRTLMIKAAPRSRRVKLLVQGAKEIGCNCCDQIRSLACAVESEEGWICEDCLPEIMQEPTYKGNGEGSIHV